ncbi:MAG TPA: nucleotide pyrophosphohydrolase [Candidatus Eisenbacteria bacterium]|uniref:Nucleotide pyrophosphohydrolase n=1 Tax=Eiseniibacteriota bacterium TaxID=2212470 RepID=A0A7V2F3M2_UNCEI|nr:nucleotide pyrophosphohydrolase [Candidatus Eisenbacteria bacterium]
MEELIKKLRELAAERDWEQFHSPKNLSMALAVEVAEILEHFQWVTEERSRNLDPETFRKVREEIGDVQIYLARLSDQLGISPIEAALEKLEINRKKYPPEKARGKATKSTDFDR